MPDPKPSSCGRCSQAVEIENGYEGRRGRTWVHLTPAGESALRNEIDQLKQLIR